MLISLPIINNLSSDELCIKVLKEIKQENQIICKNCKYDEHYWKKDKISFECKKCNFRTSLKSNTLMHRSRLPIYYWVLALNYIICKPHSTVEAIRETLNHKRSEPIYYMCSIIKSQLKKLKNKEKTENLIENRIFFHQMSFNLSEPKNHDQFTESLIKLHLEWLCKSI